MSTSVTIRKLLETHFSGAPGEVLPTAWENIAFKPEAGKAWQRVNTLHGRTLNPTLGDDFRREQGIFQVSISYPENSAARQALDKADILCEHFKRGTTLEDGPIRLRVLNSPYIGGVVSDGGWYRVTVTVPYIADVQPSP